MRAAKQLERYFKGVANHWRIRMLLLISKREGIIVEDIADRLGCHRKTASEHLRRLVHAGLVDKRYKGRTVKHYISYPYGRRVVSILKKFPGP